MKRQANPRVQALSALYHSQNQHSYMELMTQTKGWSTEQLEAETRKLRGGSGKCTLVGPKNQPGPQIKINVCPIKDLTPGKQKLLDEYWTYFTLLNTNTESYGTPAYQAREKKVMGAFEYYIYNASNATINKHINEVKGLLRQRGYQIV